LCFPSFSCPKQIDTVRDTKRETDQEIERKHRGRARD